MLGRLGMTVDECVRAYRKVAEQAFTRKRSSIFPARPSGAFSAEALENAIKETVRKFCVEETCMMSRREDRPTSKTCSHSHVPFRDEECTKTYVLNFIDAMKNIADASIELSWQLQKKMSTHNLPSSRHMINLLA
jgi:hypothetical protein